MSHMLNSNISGRVTLSQQNILRSGQMAQSECSLFCSLVSKYRIYQQTFIFKNIFFTRLLDIRSVSYEFSFFFLTHQSALNPQSPVCLFSEHTALRCGSLGAVQLGSCDHAQAQNDVHDVICAQAQKVEGKCYLIYLTINWRMLVLKMDLLLTFILQKSPYLCSTIY